MKFCNCTLPYTNPRACDNCPNNTDDFHLPDVKKYDATVEKYVNPFPDIDALRNERDTARRWARVWKQSRKRGFFGRLAARFHKERDEAINERDKLRAELEGTQKLLREATTREYSYSVEARFAEDEANQLRAELADLRGRRCDGCKWWKNSIRGWNCTYENGAYNTNDNHNHYCKAWSKKC